MFCTKEIEFLKRIGISLDFNKKLLDEDFIMIEEQVSNYLQIYGFDESYNVTEEGLLCESILDQI